MAPELASKIAHLSWGEGAGEEEKKKKPISQGPSGSGVQQQRHGDGDVASQAETHRQVCGKAIILSLNDLSFPNRTPQH